MNPAYVHRIAEPLLGVLLVVVSALISIRFAKTGYDKWWYKKELKEYLEELVIPLGVVSVVLFVCWWLLITYIR